MGLQEKVAASHICHTDLAGLSAIASVSQQFLTAALRSLSSCLVISQDCNWKKCPIPFVSQTGKKKKKKKKKLSVLVKSSRKNPVDTNPFHVPGFLFVGNRLSSASLTFPGFQRKSEVAQSCPTLCDHMDCSLPGSSSMGFSRQEYWSGVPLPSPKWSESISYSVMFLFHPMDCNTPGFSSWNSPGKQEWVVILFSRGSSQPRD